GVEGTAALFAHGHVLRILAARWLSLPPQYGRYLALDTASLSMLGHEREFPVVRSWHEPYDFVEGPLRTRSSPMPMPSPLAQRIGSPLRLARPWPPVVASFSPSAAGTRRGKCFEHLPPSSFPGHRYTSFR